VTTQDELCSALADAGIEVTQTTVSRDIAELGLVKVRDADGHMKYARPGTQDHDAMESLANALRTWAMQLTASGSLVVATTPNGYADPLAQAIDQAGHPKIIGTIAGENAVLIIGSEGTTGLSLQRELVALGGLDEG
jgi:transcriptional regulator of arginine metabolism